jgi:hypothetical protein
MSPIVEKVARAICLSQFGNEKIHGAMRCCQAGGLVEDCCLRSIIPDAEAAIAAYEEASLQVAV